MLLGITDIANRLGLDRSTVFRYVQLGKITPAGKMSGKTGALLFDADEVERFIATLPAEPTEQASA